MEGIAFQVEKKKYHKSEVKPASGESKRVQREVTRGKGEGIAAVKSLKVSEGGPERQGKKGSEYHGLMSEPRGRQEGFQRVRTR